MQGVTYTPLKVFLSTLSLRRATVKPTSQTRNTYNFYPRSPCGERRRSGQRQCCRREYFYPRSPCGERPRHGGAVVEPDGISIHALLAESDILVPSPFQSLTIFLSTLSLRRATTTVFNKLTGAANFYPRSPCGERRHHIAGGRLHGCISIHALLAESDYPFPDLHRNRIQFLSTLSLRRATGIRSFHNRRRGISIHALLAESDYHLQQYGYRFSTFLSTLSLRRATARGSQNRPAFPHFYPRSPCGERRRRNP